MFRTIVDSLRGCAGDHLALARVIAAVILMLFPHTSWAQDSLYIPIKLADAAGHSNTVTLGYHTHATNAFNWALGERPIPPVPAAPAFDVRLCDISGRRTDYPGLDSYMDLRPYSGQAQADTFFVRFQPADNNYPIKLRWPPAPARRCEQASLIYREGNKFLSVDMTRQDSLALGDTVNPVNVLVIVIRGPKLSAVSH